MIQSNFTVFISPFLKTCGITLVHNGRKQGLTGFIVIFFPNAYVILICGIVISSNYMRKKHILLVFFDVLVPCGITLVMLTNPKVVTLASSRTIENNV